MANQEQENTPVSDEQVREQIKQKDYLDIQKMKDDYEREEEELKSFFGELKKPVNEDPTVVKKQKYDQKQSQYKQALEGLDLKNLTKYFWYYEPPTPEEIEYLNLCREHVKWNFIKFAAAGLAITTFNSYKNRRYFGFPMHAVGLSVGILGGGVMGLIQSTEYVLKKFESLGPDYSLGRSAQNEIEDFRMDRKKTQKI